MKKLILAAIGLVLMVGCTVQEHFLRLTRQVEPKAVMIAVDTVAQRMVFHIEDGDLTIQIETAPVTVYGSGVFISPNYHILTCAHLFTVGPVNGIRVMDITGKIIPAELLYKSVDKDLALVKIASTSFTNYAVLTNDRLEAGQEVLAVGNPLGLPFTVTHGIISATHRDIDMRFLYTQTDAAINPGNSGGPLFNLKGELIGINAMKEIDGEGLSYAIAPETIRKFLRLFHGL